MASSPTINFGEIDAEQNKKQENVQQKLYFLNEQLQEMVRGLPITMQQKFPNELLCSLAESLVDNTIFGIMMHLMDIQHYAEKVLFNKRLEIMKEHVAETRKATSLPKNCRRSALIKVYKQFKTKLETFDRMVIRTLDEKKRDQQYVLVMAEVPGFEITDDPQKVKFQIKLIDFILRLSQMKIGNSEEPYNKILNN